MAHACKIPEAPAITTIVRIKRRSLGGGADTSAVGMPTVRLRPAVSAVKPSGVRFWSSARRSSDSNDSLWPCSQRIARNNTLRYSQAALSSNLNAFCKQNPAGFWASCRRLQQQHGSGGWL